MAVKGILAHKQLQDGSVTRALLASAVIAELDQVAVNATAIETNATNLSNHIAEKGQAGGFAPVAGDGFIPNTFIRQAGIAENKGDVATVADLVTVTSADRGDAVDVIPLDGDNNQLVNEAQTYILFGDDPTVAVDWKPVRTPKDGVFSLRNVSGTQTGLNGAVTVSDVALSGDANDLSNLAAVGISGDAADLSGLANVATSGLASDVAFTDAADQFVATTVEGALAEAMTKASDAASAADSAEANAKYWSTMVQGGVFGAQDDSNKGFVIQNVDPAKEVLFFRDGVEVVQAGFATRVGVGVTFATNVAAPASDERLTVMGYPKPIMDMPD